MASVGGHEALQKTCQVMSKGLEVAPNVAVEVVPSAFIARHVMTNVGASFQIRRSCFVSLKLATTGNKQLHSMLQRYVPCI